MTSLSIIALLEEALQRAQELIDLADAHGQRAVAIDVAPYPAAVIDPLLRALRLRGYSVIRSTRYEGGQVFPLLRVGWQRPDPQLALWDDS